MRTTSRILLALALACLIAGTAWAVDEGPAHTTTMDLTQTDVELAKDEDLVALGLAVFTTPFNEADGLGDGPYDPNEYPNFLPGKRPTLQNADTPFLRVNGLDAQSCNECHVIVSHATRPPTLGIAGVGGIVQQAIIRPTLIDVADSADDRVNYSAGHVPDLPLVPDGVADFNGRFANPPFLFGSGGVELLAKEMTAELQELLHVALNAPVGTVIKLETKGVFFGYVKTVGYQDVELKLDGVGPVEVDPDDPAAALVVKPFGRKGENFSVRDFDRGAMQFHFGVQPVEVFGANVDDDGDGLVNEITIAEMSVLHIFGVTNPPPKEGKLDETSYYGKKIFYNIGCTGCHRPLLTTESIALPLAFPEVPEDPYANVYRKIDLTKVGFIKDPYGHGVQVPLYSDLKRHDMGPRLEEDLEHELPVSNEEFITARLWGIADTAPYLHDGRAPTLYQAIEAHGGEAQGVRDNFVNLPPAEQKALLAFLKTLRVPGV